jgi:hypothetical protein
MLSAYPGGTVRTLAIDPQNYQTLYVVDVLNRVWASFNQGASWIDLTGNLASLSSDIRALEVVRLDARKHTVLIAGGLGGVFQRKLRTEGASEDSEDDDGWHALGKGLPPALVRDLHYNSANDILVAGTLGRGAWTLPNVFQGHGRRWDTALGTEGPLTLANTRTVEAGPVEEDELNLPAGLVPPVAVLLAEDE